MTPEIEVSIRLLASDQGFVYTVRRGGKATECVVILPGGPVGPGAEPDCNCISDAEFYGGSLAMD